MNFKIMEIAKRFQRSKTAVSILIFIIAFGLRLAYVETLYISTPLRDDAAKYATIAVNLVEYGTYSHVKSKSASPDAFITPGYPLFLTSIYALTGDIATTYRFTLRLQALIMAVTASLVFLIATTLAPLWAAIFAGILAAFAPHLITISGYVLTEALFTFLVCLSLYFAVIGARKHRLALIFIAALIVGLASLVRPAYLLFPVVFGVIVLLDRRILIARRIKYASLIAAAVMFIWSPWFIWKLDKESSVSSSATSFALGIYPNLTYRNPDLKGRPYLEDEQFNYISKDIDNALEVLSERFLKEPGKYLYWYFIGKPITYWNWSIMVGAGGPFIYPVSSSIYSEYSFFEYTLSLFRSIHPILVLLSLFAAVLLLRSLFRSRFDTAPYIEACLIFGCIAYFTFVHMVFVPLPRYSVPMHPLLYIAGVYSITKLLELKQKTSQK